LTRYFTSYRTYSIPIGAKPIWSTDNQLRVPERHGRGHEKVGNRGHMAGGDDHGNDAAVLSSRTCRSMSAKGCRDLSPRLDMFHRRF
jgi:hypothetical protein